MKELADILREIDFASVVLALMLVALAWAMYRAQKRDDFDWGDAFRDDNGKVSWFRTAVVISLAVSSWLLLYVYSNAIRDSDTAEGLAKVLDALWKYFATYIAVWSGSKIVDKAIDAFVRTKFGAPQQPPVGGQQ